MTHVEGFTLVRQEELAELGSQAYVYRHDKTGAQVLSITNEDTNKVFGINFRTPPEDSTGVAHIMEHSVLCGSKKYPLKEPFVELIKSSVNTFLNAMTYPDKTVYPVASQNLKDFYNLADVYLDAVLNPLITQDTFEQEGWHYDLEKTGEEVQFKGVVFNEMKGVYSSPDRLMYEESQRSIFPGHTYGVSSGGHPKNIPDLTYDYFKEFHANYYHPSNARIFFYGDDDPVYRLEMLKSYLDAFTAREVDSLIPIQERFDAPRSVEGSFSVSPDAADTSGSMMTVNWLLDEVLDPETNLALSLLDHILLGTAAAPLRKALISSQLGERLTGGGLNASLRQMYFSVGLKGIKPEDAEKVEALILDTFSGLVEDGIDDEAIEASLNTVEFSLRENNTGSYPRGLVVMLRSLDTWLHDGDPLAHLRFEGPLSALRARIESGEKVFEDMIRSRFLENTHKTTVVLHPDPMYSTREEEVEKARLAEFQKTLNPELEQKLVDRTLELRRRQGEADPPELVATLPSLSLDDLNREVELIPLEVSDDQGAEVLYHDLFTGGIVYMDVAFDMHRVPARLLPYMSLFSRSLLEMGTHKEDYVSLSRRIGRKTGGVWGSRFTSEVLGQEGCTARFLLRGKAMLHQAGDLTAILKDILLDVNLDNRDRFREMVLEEKASREARLIPSGHSIVSLRLGARFNESGWAGEQMGGLEQLFFLRQLAERIESDWSGVLADLEEVRAHLFGRGGMLANVTTDAESWSTFKPLLSDLIGALPEGGAAVAAWPGGVPAGGEGLTLPAQVNYVGTAANIYDLGYSYHGSAAVISRYLRTSWLWDRVRVQGGAYGGFCSFDRQSGLFRFLSYRDPNLKQTLDNYAGTAQFLREFAMNAEELSRSIIGTVGDMDTYQLPDAKGYTSMVRHILGITTEERQQVRDEIMSTSVEDFRAFADVLERYNGVAQIAVMGSPDAIGNYNNAEGGDLKPIKVM